jgi:negative regulator of sigma E activity
MHNKRVTRLSRSVLASELPAILLSLAIVILFALSLRISFGAAELVPAAKDILTSVRMQQASQELSLQGQLRQENVVVPFRLTQTGPVVRYSFSNPDEALQLRLGETDSRLEEITRTGVEKITAAQFDHNVRGTCVTYEDLAFKFLYWPNARVVDEDSIRTRRCWKLELHAPSRQSQYSSVSLWVDKESGALMRLEGYDWDGKIVKRFEVISAQKIEGRWYLKQMRIEQLRPGTDKVEARTYLEIQK